MKTYQHTQQFHYVHHAKFECNYGSGSMQMDHLFGTFLDKLPEDHGEVGGGGDDCQEPEQQGAEENDRPLPSSSPSVASSIGGGQRDQVTARSHGDRGDNGVAALSRRPRAGDASAAAAATSLTTKTTPFSGFRIKHRENFTL